MIRVESKKILVCDDEKSIRSMLKLVLSKEGYSVYEAATGSEVVDKLKNDKFDLLILDVMLPDISGFDVLKAIMQIKLPVIMLTAKNDVIDKVLGLEFGADDYITKPFDTRELLARIKALLRRIEDVNSHEKKELKFEYDKLQIDFSNNIVKIDGKAINLTPKEFHILQCLVESNGATVSRDELLNKVWGYDYYGDARCVDIHIARLRKKLEEDPSDSKYIVTVFGFGYRIGKV